MCLRSPTRCQAPDGASTPRRSTYLVRSYPLPDEGPVVALWRVPERPAISDSPLRSHEARDVQLPSHPRGEPTVRIRHGRKTPAQRVGSPAVFAIFLEVRHDEDFFELFPEMVVQAVLQADDAEQVAG